MDHLVKTETRGLGPPELQRLGHFKDVQMWHESHVCSTAFDMSTA